MFQAPPDELREIATAMVDNTQAWYDFKSAGGVAFGDVGSGQVQSQIGAGGIYLPPLGKSPPLDAIETVEYQDDLHLPLRLGTAAPMEINSLYLPTST